MQRQTFRTALALGALCGVAVLSLLPAQHLPQTPAAFPFNLPHFDRIVHFLLYFVAEGALLYAIGSFRIFRSALCRWGSVGFLIVYGVLMEALQHLLPSRSFDVADILANAAGAATALLLALLLLRLAGKHRSCYPVPLTFRTVGRALDQRRKPPHP